MSRGIFAPILRKIIRTFFSDKTTNQILLILSYFGGIIRMVTSLFGILLFYNLIESFNFSSLLTISGITSALTSFMIILRDNIVNFFNKGFPELDAEGNEGSLIKKARDYVKSFGPEITEKNSKDKDNPLQAIIATTLEGEKKYFSLRRMYNKFFNPGWVDDTGKFIFDVVEPVLDTNDHVKHGLSGGAIAGIVIGCVIGVALCIGLYYYFTHRNTDTIVEPSMPRRPLGRGYSLVDNQVDNVVPEINPSPVHDSAMKRFWFRIFHRDKANINGERYVSPSQLPDAPVTPPSQVSNSSPSRWESFKQYFKSPESPLANKGKGKDKALFDAEQYDLQDTKPNWGMHGNDPYASARVLDQSKASLNTAQPLSESAVIKGGKTYAEATAASSETVELQVPVKGTGTAYGYPPKSSASRNTPLQDNSKDLGDTVYFDSTNNGSSETVHGRTSPELLAQVDAEGKTYYVRAARVFTDDNDYSDVWREIFNNKDKSSTKGKELSEHANYQTYTEEDNLSVTDYFDHGLTSSSSSVTTSSDTCMSIPSLVADTSSSLDTSIPEPGIFDNPWD